MSVTQDREVLRDVGLAEAQIRGEPADDHRAVRQGVEDLEAHGVREGLEDRGLESRDLVHGRSIERRLGQEGSKVFGENPAVCAIERDALSPERLKPVGHTGQSFGNREKGHQRLK